MHCALLIVSTAVASTCIEDQIVAVSSNEGVTDLAVRVRKQISLKPHNDALDATVKIFNEFSISIVVAIAGIEGTEGEHIMLLLSFKNVRVCLFLGDILLGDASC